MERITSRTKSEEVRKVAGYDKQDWSMFQVSQGKDVPQRLMLTVQKITLRKARQFTKGHEGRMPSWSDFDPRKAKDLLLETNKELEDLELPIVDREVFHWRMRYAIGRAQKEFRDEKQASATATATNTESEANMDVTPHFNGRAATTHQGNDSPKQGSGQSLPSIHEMLRGPNNQDGRSLT